MLKVLLLLLFVFSCKKVDEKVEFFSKGKLFWHENTVKYDGKTFKFENVKFGKVKIEWSEKFLPGFIDFKDEKVILERSVKVSFDANGKFFSDGLTLELTPFSGGFKISGKFEVDFDEFENELPFISFQLPCDGERFFGFGEWADRSDSTGLERDIWVSEQHVGQGDEKPPFPLGKVLSYFPVPFFVSSGGWAFWYRGWARSNFQVCIDGNLKIKVYSNNFDFYFFVDEKLIELVARFTEIVGRQKRPPLWAFGNWIDAIFGSQKVLETAKFLRENDIPASVIWTEDWAGGTWLFGDIYTIAGWDIDWSGKLYPDLPTLAKELERMGFKFLGYFNTFVPTEREYFKELEEKGLLVKRKDGNTVLTVAPEGMSGLLDILQKEAREWMEGIMRKMADAGFSGWMADFGEYIPPDAVFQPDDEVRELFVEGGGFKDFEVLSGWNVRNFYPYLWAFLNWKFWTNYDPSGNWVFFSRSGYTGSWKFSPVIWQGDQNTTFERYDGIGSVLPSVLSLSFVGVAFVGPDIAGYTSGFLGVSPSTKKLYIRWTQLCAFLPIFRTHHGSAPLSNWRFSRDRETLEIFRKYAKVHVKLLPYFLWLSDEYEREGYPIVRHLVLNWPHITKFLPEKLEVFEQEFALGTSVVVAPLVTENDEREVFIPPGRWKHYFTGEVFDGGKEGKFLKVKVPLDSLFVIVKEGTCIPELSPAPSTLLDVPEEYKRKFKILTLQDVKVEKRCF